MDNPVIEINDNEIDVEEIMRTIRENIRRRKEAGLLPNNPEIGPSSSYSAQNSHYSNNYDLSYITSNYDIHNNSYFISSHRPYIGNFLIKGRSLVHREICRYIDPVIWKQTEFNRSIVSTFDAIKNRINELDLINNRLDELEIMKKRLDELEIVKNRLDDLNSSLLTVNANIETLQSGSYLTSIIDDIHQEYQRKIFALLHNVDEELKELSQLSKNISENKSETGEFLEGPHEVLPLQGRISINYLAFEDKFRGPRSIIKNRQINFLKYFSGCTHVLDIGCGRGEFLEIMKENNITAYGVDVDSNMVSYCQSIDLDVILGDALTHIKKLDDKSLDGIFIDQVVEHLSPDYLINLIFECSRKLKSDSYIVIETVNPLSFTSLANFYIDMTHVKPVHPETLKFLLNIVGLKDIEVIFSSPVSEKGILNKISLDEIDNLNNSFIEKFNENMNLLNQIIFGYQDYYLIGKKSSI